MGYVRLGKVEVRDGCSGRKGKSEGGGTKCWGGE